MADSDPYSRHYWRLVDDPKFADIYGDDHHYATWSRLLMLADQAWPATAHVPITARKASVTKLAEVGLIDILPGGRFRMRGTDRERRKRSERASNAARVRWQDTSNASGNAPSNADGIAQTMPSRAEHRKEEDSRAPRANGGPLSGVLRRAVEEFRWTGQWDTPRLGPEPQWQTEWGEKPKNRLAVLV